MKKPDLDFKEQQNIRTTLLVLKNKIGTWKPLARAMGFEPETLGKVVVGRRGVTVKLAFQVAHFVERSFDDVIAGKAMGGMGNPGAGGVIGDEGDAGL